MKGNELTEEQRGQGQTARQIRNAALSLIVMIALSLVVYFFNIPNPNMILIAGLTVFTSLFGYISGIVCGVEMIVYSMFFFSTDHSFISFTTLNMQKMAVIILGVVLNVAFIGHLKKRQTDDNRQLAEANSQLETDNLILQEASETDALTGVKNRFALRRDYDRYQGKFLHVMMIDLDGFKDVNDTYGHEAGDELLRRTGKVLRETLGGDCCYRYGGDEFLVICIDISQDHFVDRIEEIRTGLEKIMLDERRIPVRFSAGYVYGDSKMPYDLRLMIRQADAKMYRAKRQGKDFCLGMEFSREQARLLDKRPHPEYYG